MFVTYKNHPVVFHIAFWIGYIALSLSLTAGVFKYDSALLRVLTSGLVNAFIIYTNLYILMPRFLLRGNQLIHYAAVAAILAITSTTLVYIDVWVDPQVNILHIELFSLQHWATKIVSGIVVFSFSSSFKLMEETFEKQRLKQELKSVKLEAELKFLKTQVNPHFLFNSLNNIYTLAYTNSPEAAPSILKLSDMMRYMLYESDVERVPLQKEVKYLQNFIELQQLKTGGMQQISFTVSGNISDKQIQPMLFIPFFENSFKHGNLGDISNGWMKSQLDVVDLSLSFKMKNSFVQNDHQKDQTGGIGLENIRQRLQLLYPNKHQLSISTDDHVFSIELNIDLS